METSDKIITDLVLRGFDVHEDLNPTFEGNIRFRITVRNVVKRGKEYVMVEEITPAKLSQTTIPYLLLSRRHILGQILKEMRKQGEIEEDSDDV